MLILRLDDSQATQNKNDHFKVGESKSENENLEKMAQINFQFEDEDFFDD